MKILSCIAVIGSTLFLTACSNPIRKLEKETILKRMASLQSFTATYSETGVAPAPQRTHIAALANPVAIYARSDEGAVLHYAGGTLSTYYPKVAFGVRFSRVPELTAAQQLDWLEREYDWHIARYDVAQTNDSQVAGYATKGVKYSPNKAFSASPFSFEWHTQVEPNYAFALMTQMRKGGDEKYRIDFEKVEFQKPLTPADLGFKFPGGATIAEYDMGGKNLSLEAAKAGSNFKIALPATHADFPLKKIIRVKGIIPAYAFYFENLPYQTYYTQVKDYGLALIPPRGLVIEGRRKDAIPGGADQGPPWPNGKTRKYRVNFAGAFKSVYFLEQGVYHTIVSSRPLSEVLGWLEGT